MTNLTQAIAVTVRDHVRQRGIRQVDLALVLGLPQSAVSSRLTGRTPFTLADLEQLAEYLGVPVSDLLQPRVPQSDEAA